MNLFHSDVYLFFFKRFTPFKVIFKNSEISFLNYTKNSYLLNFFVHLEIMNT